MICFVVWILLGCFRWSFGFRLVCFFGCSCVVFMILLFRLFLFV